MRPLIVVEQVTLDGVMEGLGADEDLEALAVQRTTSAYLLGRKTYERMAAYWPHQPAADDIAGHFNSTPKYVVSRTLSWPKWQNTQVLAGDVTTSVNSLKSRDVGNLVVLGSGTLVQELIARDLVDGYRLYVHPVLVGAGKRLFREFEPAVRLRLVDYQTTDGGALVLNYSRVR
jgi:dihydrofolate reductase